MLDDDFIKFMGFCLTLGLNPQALGTQWADSLKYPIEVSFPHRIMATHDGTEIEFPSKQTVALGYKRVGEGVLLDVGANLFAPPTSFVEFYEWFFAKRPHFHRLVLTNYE